MTPFKLYTLPVHQERAVFAETMQDGRKVVVVQNSDEVFHEEFATSCMADSFVSLACSLHALGQDVDRG